MAFELLTSNAVQEQPPGPHSDSLVEPQVLEAPGSGVGLAAKHHGRHVIRAESQAFVQGVSRYFNSSTIYFQGTSVGRRR